jgi:DNA polymerase III alpha subunit
MIQNKFGQQIFSENDVCDLLMQGHDIDLLNGMIIDDSVDLESVKQFIDNFPNLIKHKEPDNLTVAQFHKNQQQTWHMPDDYKKLDIAEYVLSLCNNEAELQRCGHELLLYQERELFDLLKYLKYLIDTMTANNIVWGVGRGSSVASYVLYKIGVHKIDSMFYDLAPEEFLR